jgi:hypothetical protein
MRVFPGDPMLDDLIISRAVELMSFLQDTDQKPEET